MKSKQKIISDKTQALKRLSAINVRLLRMKNERYPRRLFEILKETKYKYKLFIYAKELNNE